MSSRFAAPPLRSDPSGDTASPAAQRLMTTGRVLPVVTDRLFDDGHPTVFEDRLTRRDPEGGFDSPRASNPSEYTLFRPSGCPKNQDHLGPRPGGRVGSFATRELLREDIWHECGLRLLRRTEPLPEQVLVSCPASFWYFSASHGVCGKARPRREWWTHCQGAQRGHRPRGARPSGVRHARHCRVVVLANMPDIPCGPRLALTRMANSETPET